MINRLIAEYSSSHGYFMKNSYGTKNQINSINVASGCKAKLVSESNIYSLKDSVFSSSGHRPFFFIIFFVYLYLFITLLLIMSLTTGSDAFIFKFLRCS